MVSDSRRIKIFLSSPGDLNLEREVIAKVCEDLSHDIGTIENFFLELVRWETHSFSARGNSPQDVINEQIGQDYDIFLGMLGRRFGTPTQNFGSGTEEEFNLALTRNQRDGEPEIMFFFASGATKLNEIDASQLVKIQNFQKSLSGIGLLYFSFEADVSLYRLAHSHLLNSIRKVIEKSPQTVSYELASTETPIFDPLAEWQALLMSDSEVNASVLMQMATSATQQVALDMTRLTKSTATLLKNLRQETHIITNFQSQSSPHKLIQSMDRLVASVKGANRQYLEVIPSLHKGLTESLTFSQRSISIFSARNEMDDQIAESLRSQVVEFRQTLESLSQSLMANTDALIVDTLPGTAFSVEQRKLSALLKDLGRVINGGIFEMHALEALLDNFK